jgi:hypothetical protein
MNTEHKQIPLRNTLQCSLDYIASNVMMNDEIE